MQQPTKAPEFLYCHVDEEDDRNLSLSINQPVGEWAKYKIGVSDLPFSEYYEIYSFSEENDSISRRAHTYFYAETNNLGNYFML